MKIFLWIIAILCVLAGAAGTLLPALPGAPLVFVGLLVGAWIDGFHKVGAVPLTILAILTGITLISDIAATALGAKRVGASRQALIGATLGAFVGIFGGLIGIILGPFIGAAIGELMASKDVMRAGQVGLATWLGLVAAAVVKLTLCFAMIGIFITAYLWR